MASISYTYLFILFFSILGLESHAQQIVLIGSDSREKGVRGNADLIMIITVRNKTVKLTSIMRDTFVFIKGHGNQKLNAAYRLGGSKLLISTINSNFKTHLSSCIETDFNNTADVIDSFGGVTVEVEPDIVPYVNQYIQGQATAKGIELPLLKSSGKVKLTGEQALAFARVRVPGTRYDDFARVERQKIVTKAALSYAIGHKSTSIKNIRKLWKMINTDVALRDYIVTFSNFLNRPTLPKSQSFPHYKDYENQRIEGVGWVLKVKDMRGASAKLRTLIN